MFTLNNGQTQTNGVHPNNDFSVRVHRRPNGRGLSSPARNTCPRQPFDYSFPPSSPIGTCFSFSSRAQQRRRRRFAASRAEPRSKRAPGPSDRANCGAPTGADRLLNPRGRAALAGARADVDKTAGTERTEHAHTLLASLAAGALADASAVFRERAREPPRDAATAPCV